MNIDINPDSLRTCMRLWRDSLSNAMPMAPAFQLHFIEQRPTILRNFDNTASAWLLAFRGATAAPGDQEQLVTLIAEIEDFQAWVKAEQSLLDTLAMEAALEAGIDELQTNHPDLLTKMAQHFRKKS